jgi:hypothetical protein
MPAYAPCGATCAPPPHERDHGTLDRLGPTRTLNRTLIWDQEHLRRIMREYEVHHNTHRPHMGLSAAAPLKALPPNVTDLDAFRAQRTRRAGGGINEYRPAACPARTRFSARTTRHGDAALLQQMREARAHEDTAALFDAAAAGSTLAATIIDTICARLARGLAAVRLILDPELIVIGGGISRAGTQLLTALERQLRPRTLAPPRLALSALGDTAVALGAVRRA